MNKKPWRVMLVVPDSNTTMTRKVRALWPEVNCDGLFVACTQLPTLEIMDTLRAELGKPVLGAVACAVWKAQRTVAAARSAA